MADLDLDLDYEFEQEQEEEGAEYMPPKELKALIKCLISQYGWVKLINSLGDEAFDLYNETQGIEKKQWDEVMRSLDKAMGTIPMQHWHKTPTQLNLN